MNAKQKEFLSQYLLAMGDDELILGHRDSEWCGTAPILEEDIAFANIALDEIAHATTWYALLAELNGEDPNSYPDQLVYFRDPSGFRNTRFTELPKGDWAFSMLRQFLFDAYEKIQLQALAHCQYRPMAEAAAKIRQEELYHFRHTSAWIRRLGLGTEESLGRLQNAFDRLLPLARQLFLPLPGADDLFSTGFIPAIEETGKAWEDLVFSFLRESGLETDLIERLDQLQADSLAGREEHTPFLKALVDEMQSVARLEPGAGW